MAGKSSYLEQKQLLNAFQNTSYTPPANVYVGLHTADPGDTGANEVSGGSYARVACTTGTSGTGAGAVFGGAPVVANGANSTKKASLSNGSTVTFPTATAGWGTITHLSLWDAATAGNLLYSAALTGGTLTITSGGTASFAAGTISVQED